MIKSDKHRVIAITGASAGVGRAVVRAFAQQGAMVSLALLARGHKGLEGARRDAEYTGAKALMVPVDVSDSKKVDEAIQYIETELGPVSIWINAAMTTVFGPFMSVTPEEFHRITEVTYLGYVYCTRAILQRMIPRNYGTIVQVGSSVAYRGIPLQTAYSGAKHAIQGFTESLRTELIHDGSKIHITMVQLPGVNTPQFSWCKNITEKKWQPIPPIYEPQIAAKAIVWAAYNRRREMYVTGSTVKAIWANKVIPGLIDKYLGKTGYASQHYDDGVEKNKSDNLWNPVDVDYGAHGDFSDRARNKSVQLWLTMHRTLISSFTVFLGLLGCLFSVCPKKDKM